VELEVPGELGSGQTGFGFELDLVEREERAARHAKQEPACG
jgi:hypothetical protein